MSIKSDKWIKEMAKNHGMIEPFQESQIKSNGNGRIVSYGTSSYGYDVRCDEANKTLEEMKNGELLGLVSLTHD